MASLSHTSSCLKHLDFLNVKVPDTAPHDEGRLVDVWTHNTLCCITRCLRCMGHRRRSLCVAECVPEVPIDSFLWSFRQSLEREYRRSAPVVQVSRNILRIPNSTTEAWIVHASLPRNCSSSLHASSSEPWILASHFGSSHLCSDTILLTRVVRFSAILSVSVIAFSVLDGASRLASQNACGNSCCEGPDRHLERVVRFVRLIREVADSRLVFHRVDPHAKIQQSQSVAASHRHKLLPKHPRVQTRAMHRPTQSAELKSLQVALAKARAQTVFPHPAKQVEDCEGVLYQSKATFGESSRNSQSSSRGGGQVQAGTPGGSADVGGISGPLLLQFL